MSREVNESGLTAKQAGYAFVTLRKDKGDGIFKATLQHPSELDYRLSTTSITGWLKHITNRASFQSEILKLASEEVIYQNEDSEIILLDLLYRGLSARIQ